MNTANPPSTVLIRAHLAAIEVVGELEQHSTTARTDHFMKIYVDNKRVLKSKKRRSVSSPRWEWNEGHSFSVHPSSTIRIAMYRKGIINYEVGEHIEQFIDLLGHSATLDLKDKNGAIIAPKIKIDLSVVSDSNLTEENFNNFMDAIDANVSGLDGPVNRGSPAISSIGTILRLTKDIMDVHPILKASWTVMSAVYMAVHQTQVFDDTVRDLAESLRELLGVAKEFPELPVILGTTNVAEEIGHTSLKVASLIDEYTKRPFIRRRTSSLVYTGLFDVQDSPQPEG